MLRMRGGRRRLPTGGWISVGGTTYGAGMGEVGGGAGMDAAGFCSVRERGVPCASAVDPGSTLSVCTHHLLAAYDEVARDVGVTDLLPSPCVACGSRLGVRYPSGWLCAVCEWRQSDVPDAELAVARVDVVYYLRFRDTIKIGTSGNPQMRLTQIRHDELLAFERGDRHREHSRHEQFAAERLERSEWFAASDRLLDHIAQLRAGADDPWDQYRLWKSQCLALR